MILTFKYRIKDRTSRKHLAKYASACNFVWNYCVEIQKLAEARRAGGSACFWPTAFDLIKLCVGTSKDLGINAVTVEAICQQFVMSRERHRKCPRFRSSRRSLGWVPFKARAIVISGDSVRYYGRSFRFWRTREISGEIKTGSFVADARGRWYLTVQSDVASSLPRGTGKIGIDLGLKALATCSDGSSIPALRHFRRYSKHLATAQRAKNKRRSRAIHAKIANSRKYHLHEWSAKLARENALIVVGNVSAAKMKKTRMAKSVSDASWSMFRNQLRYKASRHGAVYLEVDERWTSQVCSDCGAVGGPKGITELGVRRWNCSACGTSHDRDVNAAKNILTVGLKCQAPGEDGPAIWAGIDLLLCLSKPQQQEKAG